MSDSFGGAVMTGIALFFLAIFIFLIALTLQYAKAFRVKNKLVSYIEEIDGFTHSATIVGSDEKKEIYNYFKSLNVLADDVVVTKNDIGSSGDGIAKIKYNCYYTVEYNVKWEFPMFKINGTWHIKGETRNVSNCNSITLKSNEM